MEADAGVPLATLMVNGGISANQFVIRFLADLLERPVASKGFADVSALGAALLAGLKTGVYKSLDQIADFNRSSTVLVPGEDAGRVKKYHAGWLKAVRRNISSLNP